MKIKIGFGKLKNSHLKFVSRLSKSRQKAVSFLFYQNLKKLQEKTKNGLKPLKLKKSVGPF